MPAAQGCPPLLSKRQAATGLAIMLQPTLNVREAIPTPATLTLQDQITETWLRVSHPEERAESNWRSFYRRMLHNLGAKGIHEATRTEGGTCLECGEDGRCPGYHYEGER